MFGLDSISWTSFLVFAVVLCVILDLVLILVIRLKRHKASSTDTVRKKKSEFFTSDDTDEIQVKSATGEHGETMASKEEVISSQEESRGEAKQEMTPAKEEPSPTERVAPQSEPGLAADTFTEESIPITFVPQSEEEAILSSGMLSYDEMLSVITNATSDYQVDVDQSQRINDIFEKFSKESEEEKGEETLEGIDSQDEGNGFYEEDPSEWFKIEKGEENQFGENPFN